MKFLIWSLVLAIIGIVLTNRARTPPAANIGLTVTCVGAVLSLIASALWLVHHLAT